jgi:hypothetical protein
VKRKHQPAFLVFLISLILWTGGCTSNATPVSSKPPATTIPLPTDTIQRTHLPATDTLPETASAASPSLLDVEKQAGFDVLEPADLPEGAYLGSALYQETPHPNVTLQFNLLHPQYGDVGPFFRITQEAQANALPDPNACGADGGDCETLQTGDLLVKYRLNKSTDNPGADTELLMWDSGGFSFQLLRTAGEPNKTYKEELLKVVGSMK